ncbi:hypothetical protein Agub_g12622, partial [Astrephomene gubernaculifera]
MERRSAGLSDVISQETRKRPRSSSGPEGSSLDDRLGAGPWRYSPSMSPVSDPDIDYNAHTSKRYLSEVMANTLSRHMHIRTSSSLTAAASQQLQPLPLLQQHAPQHLALFSLPPPPPTPLPGGCGPHQTAPSPDISPNRACQRQRPRSHGRDEAEVTMQHLPSSPFVPFLQPFRKPSYGTVTSTTTTSNTVTMADSTSESTATADSEPLLLLEEEEERGREQHGQAMAGQTGQRNRVSNDLGQSLEPRMVWGLESVALGQGHGQQSGQQWACSGGVPTPHQTAAAVGGASGSERLGGCYSPGNGNGQSCSPFATVAIATGWPQYHHHHHQPLQQQHP